MKKYILFFLLLAMISICFMACSSAKLGSIQEDKRYELTVRELAEKENIITSFEKQMVDSTISKEKKAEIGKQLSELKIQVYDLSKLKDRIVGTYINGTNIPDEITSSELDARRRANSAKVAALLIDKVKKNVSSVDVSEGYQVILDNQCYKDVTFYVASEDAEKTAFNLKPKELLVVKLLPGVYLVSTFSIDGQIGTTQRMEINGQQKIYQGKKCFGFAKAS